MADYNGDGKSDFVLRANNGIWRLLLSNGEGANRIAQTQSWGTAGDVSLLGDYDGDGKTDLAVFRRATGTWLVKRSSDGQYLIKQWGVGTDVPVAADYDGDGKTDFAIWRAGAWYIWQSATADYRVQTWGTSAAPYYDQAAPGDYDGDGKADLTVWRASDQTWYVQCSLDGSVLAQTQGQTGDAAVPGNH